MSKTSRILPLLLFCTSAAFAQEHTKAYEQQKDSLMMTAFEYYQEAFPEQTTDQTQFLELLDNYSNNPISVNDKHLANFILLNELQVAAIYTYRTKNGDIVSWNELLRIEGITPELIQQIKPYLSLDKPTSTALKTNYLKAQPTVNYISRLKTNIPISEDYLADEDEAYSTANYKGSPLKLYNRLKFNYNQNISAGLLVEKDAGEKQLNDLTSAHISFTIPGRNHFSVLVGDYHLNIGQHLLLATNGYAGRGIGIYGFFAGGKNLAPNFSVNENSFLRGTAVKWRNKNWEVLNFLSTRKIDASSKALPTPLSLSGLHRTDNEISKTNKTNASIIGTSIARCIGNSTYQASLIKYHFDNALIENTDTAEVAYSVNVKQQLGRGILFGEFSGKIAENSKYNYVIGILQPLNQNTSIGLQYRQVTEKPIPYALPQTRSSIAPEAGLKLGFEYKPSKQWVLNVWSDQFVLEPAEYGDLKRSEFEAIAMLAYNPSKKHKHYLRLRHRTYDKYTTIDNEALKVYTPYKLIQLRLHTDNEISERISLRNRLELVSNEHLGALKGFLCFTDVSIDFEKAKLTARLAYFNISTYQYRIYTYEHDVLYSFKIPAFYGTGIRTYALYKHKISRHIKAEALVGYKIQNNGNTVEAATKKDLWDLSVQLIVNF